jgi:hypothetical protein
MSTATHVAKMWQEVSPVAGVVSSHFPYCFLSIILVPYQFVVCVTGAVSRKSAVNCHHSLLQKDVLLNETGIREIKRQKLLYGSCVTR